MDRTFSPMDSADTHPNHAGLARRLAAIAYDALLLIAIFMAGAALWLAVHHGRISRPGDWWFRIYLLMLAFAFFGGFWRFAGSTLGMQAWRLQVVSDLDGGHLRWSQTLLRFIGAGLSWALLGGGFLWALADRRGRTLHDHLSHSHLVLLPRRRR